MREPNPFEQPIIIRPVRVETVLIICFGCLLLGSGLLCVAWSAAERVGATAIGGGLLLLGLLMFHLRSDFIRIDSHGITHRRMFIKVFYAWAEVHRFDAGWFFGSAVYIQRDRRSPRERLRWLFVRCAGTDRLRLTWYFVDQFEMARKLNTWREIATSHSTQSVL